MVKVITQETFDAVVKENIEEFGLETEEAIKDAIEQFKAQVRIDDFLFISTYAELNTSTTGCESIKHCYWQSQRWWCFSFDNWSIRTYRKTP